MVLRALSAFYAKRLFRTALLLIAIIIFLLVGVVWLLAASFSGWWWLLLIPTAVVALIVGIISVVIWLIIYGLYPKRLSGSHKSLLGQYVQKIEALIEGAGMGVPGFMLVSVKDLLIHRELRTLQELLVHSLSLKSDLDALRQALDE